MNKFLIKFVIIVSLSSPVEAAWWDWFSFNKKDEQVSKETEKPDIDNKQEETLTQSERNAVQILKGGNTTQRLKTNKPCSRRSRERGECE